MCLCLCVRMYVCVLVYVFPDTIFRTFLRARINQFLTNLKISTKKKFQKILVFKKIKLFKIFKRFQNSQKVKILKKKCNLL